MLEEDNETYVHPTSELEADVPITAEILESIRLKLDRRRPC